MIHLIYKEEYKGWVSFLTYYPQFYATLGNKFFTINNGQIYQHNDTENEIRNNFYGEFHPYKLRFFSNVPGNEDVIFKTAMLESNDAWDLTINTNFTFGTLNKEEFNRRESYYYSHFRKNQVEDDLSGLKTDGVGILANFQDDKFIFEFIPNEICVGDKLYANDGSNNTFMGTISEIGSDYIKVETIEGAVITGDFYFSMKDSRTEGGDLRGYYADITITNNNQYAVELYAVNTNIIKSYV